MTQQRMNAERRKEQFIKAGLVLARKDHYLTVRAQSVTDKVGVSSGLLQSYFSTIAKFRQALVRKAIKDGDLTIIAQAMGAKEPLVKKCPIDLRRAALERIQNQYGLRNRKN